MFNPQERYGQKMMQMTSCNMPPGKNGNHVVFDLKAKSGLVLIKTAQTKIHVQIHNCSGTKGSWTQKWVNARKGPYLFWSRLTFPSHATQGKCHLSNNGSTRMNSQWTLSIHHHWGFLSTRVTKNPSILRLSWTRLCDFSAHHVQSYPRVSVLRHPTQKTVSDSPMQKYFAQFRTNPFF